MVDTRVEPDVVRQQLVQLGPTQVQIHAAVASPVVRNGATAMWNDEAQRWEILEQLRLLHELHEGRGIGIQVVRTGLVKGGIARRADVDHGRYVELDDLLVQRVPGPLGKRRVLPVPAGASGGQVAAKESQLIEATLKLGAGISRWYTWRL